MALGNLTLSSGSSLFKKITSLTSLPRTCCVPFFGFYMGYTDSIIIAQDLETPKGIRTREHFMKFGLKCDFLHWKI